MLELLAAAAGAGLVAADFLLDVDGFGSHAHADRVRYLLLLAGVGADVQLVVALLGDLPHAGHLPLPLLLDLYAE